MTANAPRPHRTSEKSPLPSAAHPSQRELFRCALNKKSPAAHGRAGNVRAMKGIGPNKACGHKGGISRQGSKRG